VRGAQRADGISLLSGYEPLWWLRSPAPLRKQALLDHCRDLMQRYGHRIAYWQVTNERHGVEAAPEAFALLRQIKPDAQLGISDCAEFWSPMTMRINGEPMLATPSFADWRSCAG